jgi:pyrimidine-nucleoside phosphorylase
MRTVDIIQKKRDGESLSGEEIRYLIEGYSNGSIPDYQVSAWAMAVFFNGMDGLETAELTMAMAQSGDQADLSMISGIKVDKHSTGGVGDKTTLVLAPLVAAAGVPVAKMSGRGLGHTGGTIDKLESFDGFQVELTPEAFIAQVNQLAVAVIGQSGNITPADKKLYALRDVTATVNSIPLIASSVMSKKIAAGANAIVLDVKTGSGAFMKSREDSIKLAQAMVEIGTNVGRETIAVISGMDEPLGLAVGNALEVKEAIAALKGEGPADLRELCLTLGAHMLVAGAKATSYAEGKEQLARMLDDGTALAKFKALIEAQGGRAEQVDHPEHLPSASKIAMVHSAHAGTVAAIEAEQIGIAAMKLGAGRETKDSRIDLGAGIILHKKVGDQVAEGEVIAELHVGKGLEEREREVSELVQQAFQIDDSKAAAQPLIYAIVDKHGVHYQSDLL